MRLYLGNLPYTVDEEQIRTFLSPYETGKIHIPIDGEAKRPRGFAFVEVSDEDGKKVIAEKHDTYLDGRRILVNEARPKEDRGGGDRGGGGRSAEGGGGGSRGPRRVSDRPDRSDKNDGRRRRGHGGGGKDKDFWR